MQWLDSPPCVPLDVVGAGESGESGEGGESGEDQSGKRRLVLRGPVGRTRLEGGLALSVGSAMTLVGARLVRLPGLPRVVPVGLMAVGLVASTLGSLRVFGSCGVDVDADGIRCWWRLPVGGRRTLVVPAADITGLRVKSTAYTQENSLGQGEIVEVFTLQIDRSGGDAIALELFADAGDAEVRRQQLNAILQRASS